MNKLLSIKMLMTIPVLFVLVFAGPNSRFYTLDQLIDAAEKNSPELLQARKEIEHTEISLQKIYSSFYPKIGMSLFATHLFDQNVPYPMVEQSIPSMVVPGAKIADISTTQNRSSAANLSTQRSVPEDIVIHPFDQAVSSIVLEQVLFNRGEGFFAAKIESAMQHITVCEYEELKKLVIAETKKRYYNVLLQKYRAECTRERVALVSERHRLVVTEYNLGQHESIDTLTSELMLEQCILEQYEAESDRVKASEALIARCGIPESPATLWIDDKMPDPVFFISLGEAVAQVQEQNSAMRQLRGFEKIYKFKIDNQKMHFLPKVSAGALFSRNYPFTFNNNPDNATSGNYSSLYARLSWMLFSGLETKRTIELARNELEQFQLHEMHISDTLDFRTRYQYRTLHTGLKKLEIAGKKIRLAELQLDEEKKHLDAGQVTLSAVKERECSVMDEKLHYMEQLYDFQCELIDFRFLIGSPP